MEAQHHIKFEWRTTCLVAGHIFYFHATWKSFANSVLRSRIQKTSKTSYRCWTVHVMQWVMLSEYLRGSENCTYSSKCHHRVLCYPFDICKLHHCLGTICKKIFGPGFRRWNFQNALPWNGNFNKIRKGTAPNQYGQGRKCECHRKNDSREKERSEAVRIWFGKENGLRDNCEPGQDMQNKKMNEANVQQLFSDTITVVWLPKRPQGGSMQWKIRRKP